MEELGYVHMDVDTFLKWERVENAINLLIRSHCVFTRIVLSSHEFDNAPSLSAQPASF